MRWSKLKQRFENGFPDSAKGRVEVWCTRYRRAHDEEGEGWITVDKQRVHSMGTLTYMIESFERANQIRRENDCVDYRDPDNILDYRAAYETVEAQLIDEGKISFYAFNTALFDYLNTPFEEIQNSEQTVIRALSMFDKRLGKRRLKTMDVSEENELVQKFFQLRCVLEGIQ